MEFEKLRDIIVEVLQIDPEKITTETAFEDLDADSLDVYQIISAISTEFDPSEKKASWCKFSDHELFLADVFSTMADEYGYFVDSVADIEITER